MSRTTSTFLAVINGFCHDCDERATHAVHVQAGDEQTALTFVVGLAETPDDLGRALGREPGELAAFEFDGVTIIPLEAVHSISAPTGCAAH